MRQTTECSAILKAYLKKAGFSDKFPGTAKGKGKARVKKGKAAPATGPALERLGLDALLLSAAYDSNPTFETRYKMLTFSAQVRRTRSGSVRLN